MPSGYQSMHSFGIVEIRHAKCTSYSPTQYSLFGAMADEQSQIKKVEKPGNSMYKKLRAHAS